MLQSSRSTGQPKVSGTDVPDRVREVLRHLERLQLRYCLLGSPDQLESSGGCQEIDLLLEESDLEKARQVFFQLGFFPIPSWGHAPHHFFVAFVEDLDLWIKLDVVTALSFGDPVRALRLDLAHAFLQRRRRVNGTFLLSPGDALLLVLLKLLLQRDSAGRRERRLEMLWELHTWVRQHPKELSRLEEVVDKWLDPALSGGFLLDALRQRSWSKLGSRRKQVLRQIFRRQPLVALGRIIWGLLVRRVRPLLYLMTRRGMWLALIAPDGSGKTTLAKALAREPYLRARYVYLGLYGKTGWPAGLLRIQKRGWLGARTGSLWRLGLHRARLLKAYVYLFLGHVVVFDRFYYETRLRRSPGRVRAWLQRLLLETRRSPDLTVLLDAPGQVFFERKGERTPQDLEQQRQAFLQLSRELPIMVLDATLSPEQLRRRVVSLIWRLYGRKHLAEA